MKNLTNIRIKPHFTLIPHSSNQVELRKGVWNPQSFTLQDESEKGKLFSILNDLTGEHTVAEISKKNDVARADVEGVLDQLQQLGVLENTASNLLDYYIDQACPSVMQRLYHDQTYNLKKMLLIGKNPISEIMHTMLKNYFPENKIQYLDENSTQYQTLMNTNELWANNPLELQNKIQLFLDWKEYFIVLAQPLMNPIVCSNLNIIAHEIQLPWIHGAIDGPLMLIGPLFTAHGPCYQCYETRVSMNLRENTSYVKYKKAIVAGKLYEGQENALQTPLVNLLASHLVLETLNYQSTGTGFMRGKVLSIYLPTMEIMFNEILKLSSCTVCGHKENRDNRQLYFDYQSLFMGAQA